MQDTLSLAMAPGSGPAWLAYGQFVVSVLGLGSILLLWHQIRSTNTWNRRNSQHNFLNNAFALSLLKELYESSSRINVTLRGRNAPLAEDEINRIMQDDRAYASAVTFLNEFENVCGAVNSGVADEELAYGIHSARVINGYTVFKPFIERLRTRDDDSLILVEFETVHDRWRTRYCEEKDELQEQRAAKALKGHR